MDPGGVWANPSVIHDRPYSYIRIRQIAQSYFTYQGGTVMIGHPQETAFMTSLTSPLDRLAALDTNTVSDALDFLDLPGATVGLRPLWDCPRIVGRAST